MDSSAPAPQKKPKNRVRLRTLAQVASIAVGIQFGWALQLSLLTPFVQELGIPHAWASYIWLCGPITGMVVQPLVGVWSDSCEADWGRRRPFMVAGAALACVSVIVIGFSADLGHLLGDPVGPTSVTGTKLAAVIIFILGFWLLDLANNTLQGPCRALLADFTGKEGKRTRRANAYFSAFMAVGNILGFAAGAHPDLHKLLPDTGILTPACDTACANLKTAFLLHVALLALFTVVSVRAAPEKSLAQMREERQRAASLLATLLPPPLESVLPVSLHLALPVGPTGSSPPQAPDAPLLPPPGSSPSYGTFSAPSSPGAAEAPRPEIFREEDPAPGSTQESSCNGPGTASETQPLIGGARLRQAGEAGPAGGAAQGTSSPAGILDWVWSTVLGQSEEGLGEGDEEGEGETKEGEEGEEGEEDSPGTRAKRMPLWEAFSALGTVPSALFMVLLVTGLTWLALFPFLLFDTDWMGREVFRGVPGGTPEEVELYQQGVRWGALGLVLNSVVQGLASLLIDPTVRLLGSRAVWALGNTVLSLCLFGTFWAECLVAGVGLPTGGGHSLAQGALGPQLRQLVTGAAPAPSANAPPSGALWVSLSIFAVMGVPLAVTYSIPYSLASAFTTSGGGGQGAAMGVLNLAVVLPQMFVSVASGPFDEHFGGGNLPAFLAASVFAALAAVAAYVFIPRPPSDLPNTGPLVRTSSSPFP